MTFKLFLGTIKPGGYLETEQGIFLLTGLPKGTDQNPEEHVLAIRPENIGQKAIVRGEPAENIIYQAQILEIVSPLAGSLLENLLKKGLVTPEELAEELARITQKTKAVKKLCALVIGHKKRSPGAVNENFGISEFDFNEDLALRIEKKVNTVDVQRVYRRTYQELPDDINALNPDFIISLHCNAFNTRASGTEVLYYHRSEKGKMMAEILLKHLVEHLKLPNRGPKPKTAEDRGGYLLRYTKAPCVIAEPFFIDNDEDLSRALEDKDGLAEAYAQAIEEIASVI